MGIIFSTINLDHLAETAEGLNPAEAISELERSIDKVRMLHIKNETGFDKEIAIIKPKLLYSENIHLVGLKENIETDLAHSKKVDELLRQKFEAIRDTLSLVVEPFKDCSIFDALHKQHKNGTQLKFCRYGDALQLFEKSTKEIEEELFQKVLRLKRDDSDRTVAVADLDQFGDNRASILREQYLDFVRNEAKKQEQFMAGVMGIKREYEEKQDQIIRNAYCKYEFLFANFECSKKFYRELFRIVNYFIEHACNNATASLNNNN